MPEPANSHLPIVLVGLPGVGKSRVGELLASTLGVPHLDTDQMVEQEIGTTISEIFRTRGEHWFRDQEVSTLSRALEAQAVVSIGGGAIETPRVRDLLRLATVVHIRVEPDELLARIRRSNKRPLLRRDPEQMLQQLSERRMPLYEDAATLEVFSNREPASHVVRQILDYFDAVDVVRVAAADPYPVIAGAAVAERGLDLLPSDDRKVLLVRPRALDDAAQALIGSLRERGFAVTEFVHPDGEAAKDLVVAGAGWDLMGKATLGRRDLVVTLGGGATTDLGGFLAATWMRGIRVAHFPTTLLAMVDAAVGGKTGINAAAGKNLIGSFHNPILVCSDLDYLKTLPQREYTAGLGEVVKAGFIADPEILRLVEEHPETSSLSWATGDGAPVLRELVIRAVAVKARVVAADFREGGLRETLNYGHTLAHAIEKDSDYQIRHGEAVSIGCVFAAELACEMGLIDRALVDRHRVDFSAMALPISYRGDVKKLVDLMYSDKKTRGGQLRFALLNGLGQARTHPVERDTVESVAATSGVILR